jgi:hypothetical protein
VISQVDVESNAPRTTASLAECDPSRGAQQQFKFVHPSSLGSSGNGLVNNIHTHANGASTTDTTASRASDLQSMPLNASLHLVHVASGLCVTVAHTDDSKGASIDVFDCDPTKLNTLWTTVPVAAGGVTIHTAMPSALCMSACKGGQGPNPPPPPSPPASGAEVVINGSALADRYYGMWAMSANGAARQLWEYPEPTRSEILDLMFSPNGMGTRWQALKVCCQTRLQPSTAHAQAAQSEPLKPRS